MAEDGTLLIAKFTSRQDTLPVERMEVATLMLAGKVGLRAPEARVVLVAGRPVALIKRFDRGPSGRVPYVSGQTMLDAEEATGGSYEAIVSEIRRHCAHPKKQLTELFGRIAFTILVSNVDDHLRNHGFVYVGQRQWGLSPAFDVNPSPERDRRLKTKIAEDTDDEASIRLLMDRAKLFDLDVVGASRLVGAMARTVQALWRGCAQSCGLSRRELAMYEPAFEHDEAEFARGLGLEGQDGPPGSPSGVARPALSRHRARPKPRRDDGRNR